MSNRDKHFKSVLFCAIFVHVFGILCIVAIILLFYYNDWFKSRRFRIYYDYMLQQDDSTYERLLITVEKFYSDDSDLIFAIKPKVNEELYAQMYGDRHTSEGDYPYLYCLRGLKICKENYSILSESGFFDDIDEETCITVTTHPYNNKVNALFPLISIQIGDKIYLDFDTGKSNWLEYINKCIVNPKLYWGDE